MRIIKDAVIKDVLRIFLLWFLGVMIIGFYAFQVLPKQNLKSNSVYQALGNWDGQHFLQIARQGYQDKKNYAFFPLYPMLIRFVSNSLNINLLNGGILISFLSSIFSLIYFTKLLRLDFKEVRPKEVATLFLFFPTSFFLIAVYSESLFLFLSIASIYYARNKNYLMAFLFGLFTPLVRIVGLAVVIALFVEFYLSKERFHKKFWLILTPIGIVLYCAYLLNQTGNPFYFLVAEEAWQRSITFPGLNIWLTFKFLIVNNRFLIDTGLLIDLLISIFGIGVALRSIRFLNPTYMTYTLGTLIIPMLTPSLVSMPRFLLVIFPLFILVYKVKNDYFQFFYKFFCILLLSSYITLFVNGFWVS